MEIGTSHNERHQGKVALGSLFSHHYKQVAQPSHITGRFNNHMKDTLLMFVDEGFGAGDKSAEGVLKNLITEPTLNIEQKGKDLISIKNNINIIITSNNGWVVPAGLGERRFTVLDVSEAYKDDHIYFGKIVDQLNDGGREAMLYDLQNYDYSNVNLRKNIKTNALLEQKIFSMGQVEQYGFSKLQDGTLTENHGGGEISKADQHSDYTDGCKRQNRKHIDNDITFGVLLNKLCAGIEETRPTVNGSRIRQRKFPSLTKCREYFEEKIGMEMKGETNENEHKEDKGGC